jgi:molybdopterin synthase catalytic subunit
VDREVLSQEPIDVTASEKKVRGETFGAVVTFQGVVRRDRTDQGTIDYLFYETYGEMAEIELERIAVEVRRQWPEAALLIQHRIGRVNMGETSVLIVVTSPHRPTAFEACRWAIDALKSSVPLWKKEVYTDGSSRWTDPCKHVKIPHASNRS